MSQHDAVRRQLVIYLDRSPALAVRGDAFSPEAIVRSDPDVLVLDLSQLGREQLCQAIETVHLTGTRLIALASIREPADERAVVDAGGLYRLKSAGADGLAEIVRDLACQAPPRAARVLAPLPETDGRHVLAPRPMSAPAHRVGA
jgi:DNA-binding NarL/FixJ family response regulator